MNYKTIYIDKALLNKPEASLLIIYTGGTLGMIHDEENGHLTPLDFEQVFVHIPELRQFNYSLTVIAFETPIDSSDICPDDWVETAKLIADHYDDFDGFVILHGTDTMAYSASALSFLLEGLNKPVIFTGAQLPIGSVRTDARENFITALEIAAAKKNGLPRISEVCIYFDYSLLRGNRAKKAESSRFDAFRSENYPLLGEAGIEIEFNDEFILPNTPKAKIHAHDRLNSNVALIKLFPGISAEIMATTLHSKNIQGIVLETYGAGNSPSDDQFIDCLKKAIDRGVVIYNVSQCPEGKVRQGLYRASKRLKEIGVVSGSDITAEAAVTKLMYLLAKELSPEELKRKLCTSLRGELSEEDN